VLWPSKRVILATMSERTLSEIEASIAELDLSDQVRLLQYLTPRIAGAVLKSQSSPQADDPWLELQAIGDKLARTSLPDAPSLTEVVSQSRR